MTTTEDFTGITQVVQLLLDGEATGDVAKLKAAFHPDARMFGHVEGTRYDMPICDYFEFAASAPANIDGTYSFRIVSISQVGDAAVATVEENGCWGSVSFTDFFSLTRIDGIWKIVNKTFAHTGGTMPAAG